MARLERFIGGFDGGSVVVHRGNHDFYFIFIYILPESVNSPKIILRGMFCPRLYLLSLDLPPSSSVVWGSFFWLQQSNTANNFLSYLSATPRKVTLPRPDNCSLLFLAQSQSVTKKRNGFGFLCSPDFVQRTPKARIDYMYPTYVPNREQITRKIGLSFLVSGLVEKGKSCLVSYLQ